MKEGRQRDPLAPPAAAWPLALVGLVILALPLVALAVGGGVVELGAALGSAGVRAALRLTAVTSVIAALVALLCGVPLALLSERGRPAVARTVSALGELPLVIPPVAIGLGLILAFGADGVLAGAVDAGGLRPSIAAVAIVLAQVAVALPLVLLAVRSGVAAMDPAPERAAAALGAGPLKRTRLATLPALRGPILLGAGLAWGRAAAEFGATLAIAAALPGDTETLPLQVFAEFQEEPRTAAAVALLQIALAAVVLLAARVLRERW